MKYFSKVSMLIVAMLVIAYASYASPNEPIYNALRNKDIEGVVKEINIIKRTQRMKGDYESLINIWNRDKEVVALSKELVNDPYIRINVIDALVQANNNGILKIDKSSMYEYLKELLENNSIYTNRILMLIPLFGNKSDIIFLEKFAYKNDSKYFLSAINALAMFCDKEVDEIFKELKNKYQDNKEKSDKINAAMKLREKFVSHEYCY